MVSELTPYAVRDNILKGLLLNCIVGLILRLDSFAEDLYSKGKQDTEFIDLTRTDLTLFI